MPTLTIDEVQARLPQIIDSLAPGEELVITRGDIHTVRGKTIGEVFPR